MCRPAPCALAAFSEANGRFLGRSRASDGTCPGGAHHVKNPGSDHEPDPALDDLSCAFDLTHDPAHGLNAYEVADDIKSDRRTKYAIRHNYTTGRDEIWNNERGDTQWRDAGQSQHQSHVHVSLWHRMDVLLDTSPWFTAAPPPPPLPVKVRPDMHVEIGSPVVSYLAARQGAWLLLENGGIITLRGRFYGAPFGKPYFARRQGARLVANPKLLKRRAHPYVVVAQTGEVYGTDGF